VHVVVVASQKGGAGKTTIARNLAVAAGGSAALVDTDPQGSLTDWWNRRQAEVPALARLDGDMAAGLAALGEGGMELVLIDTPPSVHPWMTDLLRLADLVLIPVRPSPDDLAAVEATLDLVEAAGRPFAFVVSQAKPGTILAREAVPALAQHGRVAPVVLHDRVEFPTSAIEGRGVTEREGSSAEEVMQLLHYVMTQLRKGAKKQ
jgi:chromosome partitioning protein